MKRWHKMVSMTCDPHSYFRVVLSRPSLGPFISDVVAGRSTCKLSLKKYLKINLYYTRHAIPHLFAESFCGEVNHFHFSDWGGKSKKNFTIFGVCLVVFLCKI